MKRLILTAALAGLTHLFDGVNVSDQVDVTYHLNGSSMVADSVDDPAS